MRVIILLIGAGGLVAGGFLAAFAWAVRSGQFDDLATPPLRILLDDRHPITPRSEGTRHAQPRS
jgi:cbb3-type cytochrome oxidase maturation protein